MPQTRNLFYYGSMVFTAICLGVGSALWAVRMHRLPMLRLGAWTFDPTKSMERDNIYSNATVTRYGILAAAPTEALYLKARFDDNAQRLKGDVDYVIKGSAMPARWWSLNVYGEKGYLIPNPLDRFGYNSENVRWEPDSTFTLYVGPTAKEGNWIPTSYEDTVELYIRLYQPDQSLLDDLSSIHLPSISVAEAEHE